MLVEKMIYNINNMIFYDKKLAILDYKNMAPIDKIRKLTELSPEFTYPINGHEKFLLKNINVLRKAIYRKLNLECNQNEYNFDIEKIFNYKKNQIFIFIAVIRLLVFGKSESEICNNGTLYFEFYQKHLNNYMLNKVIQIIGK